jgi:uncharacterized protein (DUF2267 family)
MARETVKWAAEALRRMPEPDAGQALLKQIEQSGVVPTGSTSTEVASAVLCTLARRLSGGEARDLLAALPPAIQPLLRACGAHERERAEVFDHEELLRRVQEHFETLPDDTEEIVRVVFRALHSHLPQRQIDDIASQLPRDFADIWRAP